MAFKWLRRNRHGITDPQRQDQTVPDADLIGRVATIAADHDPASAAEARAKPTTGATTQFRLEIDHGLVMVFGPEDDPVPPRAFAAAAAEQPGLLLTLPDGAAVPARRVAAVLEAQASGQLQPLGQGDDAWLRVMLGLEPQPDEASPVELKAEKESESIGLAAFGNELMLRMPSGGSLVIVDAKSGADDDEATVFFLPDGDTIAVRSLIGLMRAHLERPGSVIDAGASNGSPEEFTVPQCEVEVEADLLVLHLPIIGDLRLATVEGAPPDQPRVSVFLPNGEAAVVSDLLSLFDPGREEPTPPTHMPLDHDAVDGDAIDTLPLDIPMAMGPEGVAVNELAPPTTDEPAYRALNDGLKPDASADEGWATVVSGVEPEDAVGDASAEAALGSGTSAAGVCQSSQPFDDIDPGIPVCELAADGSEHEPSMFPAAKDADTTGDEEEIGARGDDTSLVSVDGPTSGGGRSEAAVAGSQQHGPGGLGLEASAGTEAPGDSMPSVDGLEPSVERCVRTEPCMRPDEAPAEGTSDPGSNRPMALATHVEWEALEPDQSALVIIDGVPKGATLSAGTDNRDGSWSVSPAEIEGLLLQPPPSGLSGVTLTLTAIGLAGRDGDLVTHTTTATLPAIRPTVDRSTAPRRRTVPLEIDARLTAKDALDAVIVRGVPREARLSAGTYDPTIDGWALLPVQLPGLTMTVDGDQTQDIELTIVGINLASGTPSQSRLLAVLPIEMA